MCYLRRARSIGSESNRESRVEVEAGSGCLHASFFPLSFSLILSLFLCFTCLPSSSLLVLPLLLSSWLSRSTEVSLSQIRSLFLSNLSCACPSLHHVPAYAALALSRSNRLYFSTAVSLPPLSLLFVVHSFFLFLSLSLCLSVSIPLGPAYAVVLFLSWHMFPFRRRRR